MTRDEYDALAAALEVGLRRQYPEWEWEVLRYRRLPFADTIGGPPKWARIRAGRREQDERLAFQTKQWLIGERSIAALVTEIGQWIERERDILAQERERKRWMERERERKSRFLLKRP